MFKEKVQGFRYLFSDREVRLVSVLSFSMLLVLVSTQFLVDVVPERVIYVIGFVALVLFTYIACFFILFLLAFTFGKFKDNRKIKEKRNALWTARMLSFGFTAIAAWLSPVAWIALLFWPVTIAFVGWIALSTIFFCKFVAGIAGFARAGILRAVIYIVIIVAYVLYLVASIWWKAFSSTSTGTGMIDDTTFDWILALFLLVYGYATMGQRFLPKEGFEKLDFDHLSWKQETRLRAAVLLVLLLSLGHELLLRSLGFLFARLDLVLLADLIVVVLRLAFLIPGAIAFFFVAIFKKKGKK